DEEPGGLDLHGCACELELHALERGDGVPELLSFLRIGRRVIERPLGKPEHLRTNANPAFIQRLDGDLVALADFAEDTVYRHCAVLEDQLTGAAGADAELVFLLANREAGRTAVDQERRDPAIAGVRVDV